jgi:nitrogenase molybdenum-iron protein beta chain
MGPTSSAEAAKTLDAKCKVPCEIIDLPIGLRATDRMVDALRRAAGVDVPETLNDERGQLVDMMADMAQYTHGKRVALWGDPDQLISLSAFLLDLDMIPAYVITGTPGKQFEKRFEAVMGDAIERTKYRQGAGADMFLMHQWIKNEPVDLLIGNTYGKYIARDEDIPLIRHGFPILDRVGHQYFPTAGYRGAMRLLEMILNAFLDRQDRDSPEESFELVM